VALEVRRGSKPMAMEQVLAVIAATVTSNTPVVSPKDLAVIPLVQKVVVPEYDFLTQQRFSSGKNIKVAAFTFNSAQTYDFQGRPSDARADNND
jgi:hypothetical protein